MTGELTEGKEQRWRLTPAGRRLASALAWGLRWKALAKKLRNQWTWGVEAEHEKLRLEAVHLRRCIRAAVRLLERDLEFGERSAYVEEALELLR